MKKTVLIITRISILIFLMPSILSATEIFILSFDDLEIEVRNNMNEYNYVDSNTIGIPPIPVIDIDEYDFYKIKSLTGDYIWLNASYVKTNANSEDLYSRIGCQTIQIGRSPDNKQFAPRGIGKECD